MHRRWRPFWGSACCFCPCAAWYAGLTSRAILFTSACVAAHPRATVQAFSLGNLQSPGLDASDSPFHAGTSAYDAFYNIAWIAIGVGGILGIVALINEVRALASVQRSVEGLLSTECMQTFELLYTAHLKAANVFNEHPEDDSGEVVHDGELGNVHLSPVT